MNSYNYLMLLIKLRIQYEFMQKYLNSQAVMAVMDSKAFSEFVKGGVFMLKQGVKLLFKYIYLNVRYVSKKVRSICRGALGDLLIQCQMYGWNKMKIGLGVMMCHS